MHREYFLNVLKREAKDIKDFELVCDCFMNLRQVKRIKTKKDTCEITLKSDTKLNFKKSEIPAFL
jgi:hypothetical protein